MFRKMSTMWHVLAIFLHTHPTHKLIQNRAKDNWIITYLQDQDPLILLVPEQKK